MTTIENARMEWNSARLKISALAGESRTAAAVAENKNSAASTTSLADLSFGQLCKIGLAFTWPLLLVALAALGVFIAILLRK